MDTSSGWGLFVVVTGAVFGVTLVVVILGLVINKVAAGQE